MTGEAETAWVAACHEAAAQLMAASSRHGCPERASALRDAAASAEELAFRPDVASRAMALACGARMGASDLGRLMSRALARRRCAGEDPAALVIREVSRRSS